MNFACERHLLMHFLLLRTKLINYFFQKRERFNTNLAGNKRNNCMLQIIILNKI